MTRASAAADLWLGKRHEDDHPEHLVAKESRMSDIDADRRALLGAGAFLAAAVSTAAAAAPARPQTKPLPFDPGGVPGLSEKLLRSHYDNNYTGAVTRLGAISAELAGLDPAATPGYRLNGLKREELIAWNSMILHEVYFAGFGPAERPSAALAQAVERDFGSHGRWTSEFAAMGKALGGGSGWVLLTWSRRDGRLVNTWAADHTMALADSALLLALDMYEHAYHMDFGAKAGAYVDAFMTAFSWNAANGAFARAGS
jgi:Fe-Mn family superoxide dismutase